VFRTALTRIEQAKAGGNLVVAQNRAFQPGGHDAPTITPTINDKSGKRIQLGATVFVITKNGQCEGVVKWLGEHPKNRVLSVGVQLTKPVGDGDGSIKKVRLFESEKKYAVVVNPENVTVQAAKLKKEARHAGDIK